MRPLVVRARWAAQNGHAAHLDEPQTTSGSSSPPAMHHPWHAAGCTTVAAPAGTVLVALGALDAGSSGADGTCFGGRGPQRTQRRLLAASRTSGDARGAQALELEKPDFGLSDLTRDTEPVPAAQHVYGSAAALAQTPVTRRAYSTRSYTVAHTGAHLASAAAVRSRGHFSASLRLAAFARAHTRCRTRQAPPWSRHAS